MPHEVIDEHLVATIVLRRGYRAGTVRASITDDGQNEINMGDVRLDDVQAFIDEHLEISK